MNLNDILLSSDLVQEWYGNKLVLADAKTTSAETAGMNATTNQFARPKDEILPPIKGGLRKGVLWLVQEPESSFLNDEDFELLTKVLQACKLNWDDAGLMNVHPGRLPVATIVQHLKPRHLICCGIDAALLGETAPLYTPLEGYGCEVLVTDAVSAISSHKEKKVLLWNALKQMLQIQ